MPTVTLTGPHRYYTGGRLWKNGQPVEVDQATAERFAEDQRFRVSFARSAAQPAQPAESQEVRRSGGVKITRGKPQNAAGPAPAAAAEATQAAAAQDETTRDTSTDGALEV